MDVVLEVFTGALSGFAAALGAAIFSGSVSLCLRIYRKFKPEELPDGWYDNSAVLAPGHKKRKIYTMQSNKFWRKQMNIRYPYIWQTVSAILFILAVVLYYVF